MSLYLPDTNTISLLARHHPEVTQRLIQARRDRHRFVLCPLVEYEIRRGLDWRPRPRQQTGVEEVLARMTYTELTQEVWLRGAALWAHSRREGEPLPDSDILIAAHAIELSAILVTDNTRHFRLFEPLGLQLENWVTPAP